MYFVLVLLLIYWSSDVELQLWFIRKVSTVKVNTFINEES